MMKGSECPDYMIAVDNSVAQTQRQLMQAISDGIGSGAVSEITIGQAIKESWCDFMTIDVCLESSIEFKEDFKW